MPDIATVTMVLSEGSSRWYIEAIKKTGERISLHLNIAAGQRVPEVGDELELPE